MDKSSLANRMKKYEGIPRIHLTPRMPLIIRLDGKAFHTYTRGFDKPWDSDITLAMGSAAHRLIEEIQGAKLVYIQSDELSVLVNDYESFETQAWFDKNLQKIVSVSASIVTAYFNKYMWANKLSTIYPDVAKTALFDSRAFVIPREEACNYFVWRQQDAERNSVSSLAQTHFSHKTLQGKNVKEMRAMLLDEKQIDWDTLPVAQKRGWCVLSSGIDTEIPRFQEDREYINKHLVQVEE
jgi:tRNA(His) guanylyltransferase